MLLGNARCIAIDPWLGTKREVCDLPNNDYQGYGCPSVLLPLTPNDGYRSRVLLCGGSRSQIIDLGEATPTWMTVPRNGAMEGPGRNNASATILPTGDVLMTGGADRSNDQSGVMDPEQYLTPIDHAAGVPNYVTGPGSWKILNDPATVLRNYHSTALLMPDGNVWTAGGNSPKQPDGTKLPDGTPGTDGAPGPNQMKIEIFSPPYPGGTRPKITSCPRVIAYGDVFQVQTPQALQISAATLLRCGSSTHAFNPDQRCIFLSFTLVDTTNRLHVTAPPTGGVAPPGNYMLFLVDNAGRPCEYASFVRVGGQMSLFTDRSIFSQHEVEALLSGPDPSIQDAIYVVLDGFTALDIAGTSDRPFPPTLTFTLDDNSIVPGLAADLSSTLYESPTAPQGVTQRITLGYRIAFTNNHAFDGIAAGNGRAIVVTAQWGPSRVTGRIMVFSREHVYSLDGPVPWLSIDVQVVQLARNDIFAGERNSDPAAFIRNAIRAMRDLPDNSDHPFEQLAHNNSNAVLELAHLVNGIPRDNFAFARVRFRAPSGVNASDVRVFFRMFPTTGTALTYNEMTTYRRLGNGATAVALPGIVNNEIVSQPFFAFARNPNPNAQQDPSNVDTLHGAGDQEAVSFYGTWLDFNHETTIRNRIRGQHQCLVAEIHYLPSLIPIGATPADNDQLSQRNLAIVESDNPGDAASHTVAHTFDLKPSQTRIPMTLLEQPNTSSFLASPSDELFIRWHNLPHDSLVEIYLPDIDIDQVLLFASSRAGYGSLTVIDEHTIGCRVGDVTYLPLPGDRLSNIAGMLTIQLPPTVETGTIYSVSAHQISGLSGSIIASFQMTIPISTANLMLPEAQRTFDVLNEIGTTISISDRWRPIFDRYLKVLESRLVSIGGSLDGGGGQSITQIKVHIETGNKDPNKNMRVYLGFEGKHGREFRMRTTDDSNPFRENTALDIIFGSGANVRDKNINDPTNPAMDKTQITGAYIRIEPRQEEPWKIASAQVFINGSATPTFSLKLPNVVLEDDAGEKVSLG
jgi:hypothetical protein